MRGFKLTLISYTYNHDVRSVGTEERKTIKSETLYMCDNDIGFCV